ncbi:uncharacterized protein RSE6_03829 [Rhynchosporium secalis]|uniref:AMP-dependent synthetase/ligase domain-containing protein n=1 Tax=Rhynchosporium secalis TaxID=38038 RepID=A0A1E1M3S4_RHYSE|nr:uncharacterized protein RSE6_03829 [Rhynchosporium secalis]
MKMSDHNIKELLNVPPMLIRLVCNHVVSTGFKEGYGITESCSCIAAHPPDIYEYKYVYTVGAVCASTPIKIIDDYGKEVGISQLAELLAEGLQITIGYSGKVKAMET